jgi:hypothetical protein
VPRRYDGRHPAALSARLITIVETSSWSVELLGPAALSRLDEGEEYGVVWYPKRRVQKLDPDPERGYRRSQKVSLHPAEERIPIPAMSSGIPREVIDAAREALSTNRVSRSSGHRIYELGGFLRCAFCNNLMATTARSGPKK